MDQLWLDVRYSIRILRKNPALAWIAILVLALGIGASTAIFSVVNAVLIRPLPYRDPSRLVAISSMLQREGKVRTFPTVSLTEVEGWRAESRSMQSIGSFVFSALPVYAGQQALFLVAIGADPELLETLGIQPVLGRNLAGSGSRVKDSTVIISHRLWSDAFRGDPEVLGKPLTMDGTVYTVGGVLPAAFQFPRADASYFAEEPDIIFPVANIAEVWGRDSTQWFAIGRLKSGVAIGTANAELRTLTAAMAGSDPALRGMSAHAARLDSETTGSVRPALLVTLGISLVLLLIACTNIMNLLLSRAAARAREMAVRKAAGATRWRLARQMLTESACLTFTGGALGVMLARLALDGLVSLSPAHLPFSGRAEIDWTVLGFAFLVCAVAALSAGVLPALNRGSGPEILVTAARSTASGGVLRFQRVLMVAQIALGAGLLSAAGLLTHSLYRLNSVNPGFRTQGTLAFELAFPSGRPAETPRLYDRILEATRGTPGVISAGWITSPPPETRAGVFLPFSLPGWAPARRAFSNVQVTSEEYFETAGIALSRGRTFTAGDGAAAPAVAIINEALARQYYPDVDPLGRRIAMGFDDGRKREIVGVIADIRDRGLSVKSVATVYVPYRQFTLAYGGIVARVAARPEAVIPEIRRRIAKVDPTVPLRNFATLDGRVRQTLDAPRFYTIMAAACAMMAVLFVTLGLYGVISHAVSRRTSEIGIRMALGAERKTILRAIMAQALGIAGAGVAIGIALSLASARLLETLLFEVKPADPTALAGAAVVVVLVTLPASYFPARRASLVQPIEALRHE